MEFHHNHSTATKAISNIRGRALRPDWLGQTAASLFWIVSIFAYGIESSGDWLQLSAASAWMAANLWNLTFDT